jgi:ATP-binding cassette, subfamily B, multidrug efflux pump
LKALGYLNKYFFKYRFRLLLGIAFVVLSNLANIIPARLIRQCIDLISRESLTSSLIRSVSQLLLLFVLITLLRGVFLFLMRQTIIVMSRLIEYDLKNEIFEQYQRLNTSFYRRNNTGDLMARISEDVSRVRMYLGPAVMYTINLMVLFILTIGAMLSVNTELTFFALSPLPVMFILIYKVSDTINHKSERVQAQLSTLSTFVQEAFSGIRVIKSFTREAQSVKDYSAESNKYRDLSAGLAKTNAYFSPLILLLIGLSTLITVYIGGKQAIEGKITMGNIAEFIIYINLLTWPVASVGWVTSLVQRASASQERINEFLHQQPEITSPTGKPLFLKGKIEFVGVSFSYPGTEVKALDNISFTVEPGQSLGIMGKTGSGKSTIVQLLLRQYDPTEGIILIDGEDLRNINLKDFRTKTGYVPQDVFLFSDTISNNIAFGLNEKAFTEAERSLLIEEASREAVIYDNIQQFPGKFETVIGERGITLSGGQKQRVSIARALIKKPDILILDDCLSAVDTHTEEAILNNLRKAIKNRTSIIVSHRVSSVKNTGYILLLEHGRIAEEGTHASLLAHGKIYAELYEKQLKEQD